MNAKVIVFEGPDKAGKETQSKLAVEALHRAGARVVRVEVPCKEAPRSYRLIYRMLKSGAAKRWPNAFQFVQFVNKLAFQLFTLPGLLHRHDLVVLDRWGLSAVIYGNATGVNPTFNLWLYGMLRKANLTIVFSERSFRRTSTQDDSYESDNELQARVRTGYRDWALSHPRDHALISNSRPIDQVHDDVIDRISPPCNVCKARLGERCDAGLHS